MTEEQVLNHRNKPSQDFNNVLWDLLELRRQTAGHLIGAFKDVDALMNRVYDLDHRISIHTDKREPRKQHISVLESRAVGRLISTVFGIPEDTQARLDEQITNQNDHTYQSHRKPLEQLEKEA